MPAFLHPTAAWLFPAVALPVIFHLFFRLRRQVRDFPALLFFQRIDPRLSSKRRVHEWLILLLRCLFLALLVAALLRPLFGSRGAAGSLAHLVLIDNSGSMAGPFDRTQSKFDLAKNATLRLIAGLPAGDRVAVQLTVPDPVAALPEGFDAPPAVLSEAVQKLVVSDGAGSMPRALRRGLALLEGARAARRELVVVTDLQRDNWSRGDMAGEPVTTPIIVQRVATATPTAGLAALAGLELPDRALPVGRITPLRATVRNEGPVPAHVRLNSTDDSGRNQTRDLDVPAHGTGSTSLEFSFSTPGFHWAECWLEGDVAPMATRMERGFWCISVRKVLFVGSLGDYGGLPFAVSPGGGPNLTGLESDAIPPEQLAGALNEKPLAVVTTWDRIDPALEGFVRGGGILLIVPRVSGGGGATAPAWLGAQIGELHSPSPAEPMLLLGEADPIWHDLRDASGRPHLGTLRAFRYRPVLAPGREWTPLLAAGQGGTLFTRRTLGDGRVLAGGLALTPGDSSLPLRPGFVVFVQNALFDNRSEVLPLRSIQACDDVSLPAGNQTIKSLAGSALLWRGAGRMFPGFPRSGIDELRSGGHAEWIAVSANPAEARPDFLPLGPVPLLRSVPHQVVPLLHEDDLAQIGPAGAMAVSWYRWLLLAALLVLLAETWLANERSSELGRNLFKSLTPRVDMGRRVGAK